MASLNGSPAVGDVVLDIEGLVVEYRTRGSAMRVLPGVDLTITRGEVVGLVGESGSGKSTLALAALRLLPANGRIAAGRIVLDGTTDVTSVSREQLRRLRGEKVAMIFQDPLTSLNPTFKIGRQMIDVQRAHCGGRVRFAERKQFQQKATALLREVGLPDADQLMHSYPHQLSGGMRQRVMTAMALSLEPELLIADEPTSALDVTTEAQILNLMRQIKANRDLTILFVTHDLSVVAEICDRVVVMYAGQVMEQGDVADVFERPQHPYTRALLDAVPTRSHRGQPLNTIPGRVPSLIGQISGCRFASRCAQARDVCRTEEPRPVAAGSSEVVRCHMRDPESGYERAELPNVAAPKAVPPA